MLEEGINSRLAIPYSTFAANRPPLHPIGLRLWIGYMHHEIRMQEAQ